MRLSLCLPLVALPVAGLADCPAEGQMPSRILYADGKVEEAPLVANDVFEVTSTDVDGTVTIYSAKYGIYFENLISGETAMMWTWTEPERVPASMLPVGEDQVFMAKITSVDDGMMLDVRYTYTSRGPETLVVGDCEVPVIRLDERQDFLDGSGSIVSQLWIDPERMLILKTERDKLDAAQAVVGHKASLATGFEL